MIRRTHLQAKHLVIENYAPEPIEPYIVQPKSIEQKYNKVQSSPSPFVLKSFPRVP